MISKALLTNGLSTWAILPLFLVALCFAPAIHAETYRNSTKIKVLNRDGSPAAGQKYRLVYTDPGGLVRTLLKGTVPEDGFLYFENLDEGANLRTYVLRVGRKASVVGHFRIEEGKKKSAYEFMIPPLAGDTAPDISFVNVFTGKKASLSDFRGKVVFLDFWATWCPPCQKPMAHNNELIAKREQDWKDKVVILALSIDETVEVVQEHVRKNDWMNVSHFWSNEGPETGWKSNAPLVYGVESIPTVLIIDPEGAIVWRGSAAGANPEERIDQLLENSSGR